ncbi:AAA family ATPase [Methylocucumis oryzae]|uniref:AAA family ATPase n=1 Tax=Methylocucumis oryzae TaxID=1632867 RepID=UPI000AF55EB7|nr:AAA family ATPase [Methylocucumis oryzae]
MINELKIYGFKMFEEAVFKMAPLTILAGMNGAGKTSVIHALLLIREIARRNDKIAQLNGPYGLDLGTFGDIQNWNTQDPIRFVLTDEACSIYTWVLGGNPASLYAEIQEHPQELPPVFKADERMFQYLCAERFGPRNILGSAALPSEQLEVGFRGEYSAQVLYDLGGFYIDAPRRCPDAREADAALLKFETERWLSRIARPVQIDTESLAIKTVTALRFRVPGGEWVHPPNMGFGVTYSLPVILAGLTAGKDGILIIENPEAHLHPAGQSQMGYFLASIASAGVQVVVETHSDHVLNGIRRAIGEHSILSKDQAIIHFF